MRTIESEESDGSLGRSSSASAREAFETLADWVAALHGGGRFQHALERLTRLLGGEAGLAIRHAECTGRQRQIAVAVPDGELPVQRRRSVTRDALGESLGSLRAGAVWVLSEARRDATFLEEQWVSEQLESLGIRDVAAIFLGTKAGCVDYCEIQFRQVVARQTRARLDDLAPVLSRAWEERLPGTAERLIARRRAREDKAGAGHGSDLLGVGNPAELSRCEYRICVLVREGLLARAIAEQLVVSESTVRSHLRSIYAKTGAAGHVDLLHRLIRLAPPSEDLYRAAG